MKKILVIEDDIDIANLLKLHLTDLPSEVVHVADGNRGLEESLTGSYDLILLDIMLPGIDGIEVCRKVKSAGIITPIIMLTARSEEIDKVVGLELGANDYITKPFSIRELLARVKAVFRLREMIEESLVQKNEVDLDFGELSINIQKRKVVVKGQKVELSPKEYELLVLMASNPGQSYSRTQLLNLIWGYDFDGYEHTINSHINRLRSKIESDMNKPNYILTTWAVGYKFNEEA
jgi:DNA-binding response OmpR family regulator